MNTLYALSHFTNIVFIITPFVYQWDFFLGEYVMFLEPTIYKHTEIVIKETSATRLHERIMGKKLAMA